MENIVLEDDERLDEVNYRIRLVQKTKGLTFGTDALLLAAYMQEKPKAKALEIGGGSGIISLLCLAREKFAFVDCVEIQASYALLIGKNIRINRMENRMRAHCADIRDYATDTKRRGTYDIVFANPPYMHTGGAANKEDEKNIARHEIHGNIADFCRAAQLLLRYGGKFYCVYRPDRMIDLLCAMRENKLEPKRITLVYATKNSTPSMLLVEATLGGKSGLRVTRPLILYQDGKQTYTADMEAVMNGDILPQAKE